MTHRYWDYSAIGIRMMSFASLVLGMRLLRLLLMFSYLGPLVLMVSVMMWDVIKWLLLQVRGHP